MKKFLIGCGIAFLLFVILFCGFFGFLGYKANQISKGYTQAAASIATNINESIEQYAFEAPESIHLDPQRFQIMIEVRKATSQNIKQDPLLGKFIAVMEQAESGQSVDELSAGDIYAVATQLGPKIQKISQSFFDQLEANDMSFLEYRFLTEATMALIEAEYEKEADTLEIDEEAEQFKKFMEDAEIDLHLSDYKSQWQEADPDAYNAALQLVVEHEDAWDEIQESVILDFVLLLLEQGNPQQLQKAIESMQ